MKREGDFIKSKSKKSSLHGKLEKNKKYWLFTKSWGK
jgi:hypothetical protein